MLTQETCLAIVVLGPPAIMVLAVAMVAAIDVWDFVADLFGHRRAARKLQDFHRAELARRWLSDHYKQGRPNFYYVARQLYEAETGFRF